jgi:hypothetical protein
MILGVVARVFQVQDDAAWGANIKPSCLRPPPRAALGSPRNGVSVGVPVGVPGRSPWGKERHLNIPLSGTTTTTTTVLD